MKFEEHTLRKKEVIKKHIIFSCKFKVLIIFVLELKPCHI
jgi:hypothetical protein